MSEKNTFEIKTYNKDQGRNKIVLVKKGNKVKIIVLFLVKYACYLRGSFLYKNIFPILNTPTKSCTGMDMSTTIKTTIKLKLTRVNQ